MQAKLKQQWLAKALDLCSEWRVISNSVLTLCQAFFITLQYKQLYNLKALQFWHMCDS